MNASKSLKIAEGLALPAAISSQAVCLIGVRGSGKTNSAGVMAEELLDHGQPIVVIDPTDAWFGLRSSRDGKSDGYPIYVFGGPHGDLDLLETSGKEIAEFVATTRVSVILSLRHLRKNAQRRFVTDFCEELYHLKGKPEYRSPLTVFIDEAPLFVPQKVMGENARTVGAVEDLIARGRNAGFGVVLISQRMATVNKDVATQCDTIICHRVPSPQDRKAISDWFEENASVDELKAILASLATLRNGEAWVWAPSVGIIKRTQIRLRKTYDSSATPQGTPVPPKVMTKVDIEALRSKLAASVERTKADDPKELKKEIAKYKAELAQAQRLTAKEAPKQATSVRDVPLLTDADRELLERLDSRILGFTEAVNFDLQAVKSAVQGVVNELLDKAEYQQRHLRDELLKALDGKRVGTIREKLSAYKPPSVIPQNAPVFARPRTEHQQKPITEPKAGFSVNGHGDASLGKVHRAFLTVLANRQGKYTARNQLAVFSGYSAKSRHVDNTISACRTNGWLEGDSSTLRITNDGLAALGSFDQLPSGQDLRAYWIREAGAAPGAMLKALTDVYPRTLSRDQVAEASNYSVHSRHVDNSLSYLRTLELITGDRSALRASEELF